MKLLKPLALITVTLSLTTIGTTATSAAPTLGEVGAASSRAAPTRASELATDENLLEFLATGRGPMAGKFPELLSYLPRSSARLTSAERSTLVDEYMTVDAAFHETVTVPVQSGDPYKTLGALDALTEDTQALAAQHDAMPDGSVGKCATLVAVALWLVVALAVVLWVPARIADDTGSSMTTREFAAQLASSMQTRR